MINLNLTKNLSSVTEIDKLAWLCIHNRKLLGARSKDQDLYYLPGGKRETGETDQAALIREIREELSVELDPATIEYVATFKAQAHDKHEGVMVKITCYHAEYAGSIQANAEIAEVKWLSYVDKACCSEAAKMIMDWLQSVDMIE